MIYGKLRKDIGKILRTLCDYKHVEIICLLYTSLLGSAFVEDTIDITYNGYENPGLKVNKQWKAELTLRDILRHQAGFPLSLIHI